MSMCEEEEEAAPELTDPQDELREQCRTNKCQAYVDKYEACNDRVNSKEHTRETCMDELCELLHCVDHCVGEKLFSLLK